MTTRINRLADIYFSKNILGASGMEKLKQREITQTLRLTTFVMATNEFNIMERATILGAVFVGRGRLVSVDFVRMKDLTIDDATRGGFDTISELKKALNRAGFRFKAEYLMQRMRFRWC